MKKFIKKLASYVLVPLALATTGVSAEPINNRFTNMTSKLEQAMENAGHDLYDLKATGIGGEIQLEGGRGGHGVAPMRIKTIGSGFQLLVTNIGDYNDDLFFVRQGDGTFTEEARARGLVDNDGGTHGPSWNGRILIKGNTREKYDSAHLFNPQTGIFEKIPDFGFEEEGGDTKTRSVALLPDLSGNGLFGAYLGRHTHGDQLYQPVDFTHVALKNSLRGESTQGVSAVRIGNKWYVCAADREGNRIIEIDAAWNPREVHKLIGIRGTEKVDGGAWADWNGDGLFDLLVVGNEAADAEVYFGKPDGMFQNLTKHFRDKYRLGGQEYMPVVDEFNNEHGLDLVLGDRIWYQNGREIVDGISVPILDGPYPVGVHDEDIRGVVAVSARQGVRDLVYAEKFGAPKYMQNNTPVGSDWLDISVSDPHGGFGIGADILVYNTGNPEDKQLFQVMSANGYCAQPDSVIHFAGQPGNRYNVTVTLPGGLERTISKVGLGQAVNVNF